jgi:peptidoglycan-associated lipoprotein
MRTHVIALFCGAVALAALSACSESPDTASDAGGAAYAASASPRGGLGGAAGLQAGQPVPGSEQDLQKNVGDRIFFATDKVDISAEGRKTLERQAQWLRRYPNVTVTIEGHCDERGTREYNLALGARRASAAKQALVALGIPANRIQTISYGKERPAVVGSNEAAWAQNRRAVTVVN